MNFDITAEITFPDSSCSVDHYRIWDRFGERSIVISETLQQACSVPPVTVRPQTKNRRLRH
jgi:hypothetical protein